MEFQDKTFKQAIEDLHVDRANLSEEKLFEQIMNLSPLVQQAVQDERTIESVVAQYFPREHEQTAVTSIYQAAQLRLVLDTAREQGMISKTLHNEFLRFLYSLVQETKQGKGELK